VSVPAATALTLWGAAHAGGAAADDVLAAVAGFGISAGVRRDGPAPEDSPAAALPGPGEAPVGAAMLLPLLRSDAPVLVLPRDGDVRGLPATGGAGSALVVASLRAGAAVVLPHAAVTVVPMDGQWRVFAGSGTPDLVDPVVAREGLDHAVVRATEVFAGAELGTDTAAARAEVAAEIVARTVVPPPGTPARATALLDRCAQLEAILSVTARHRTAAVTVFQLDQVDEALLPLIDASRQARRAATAMTVHALLNRRLAGDSRLRTPDHRR